MKHLEAAFSGKNAFWRYIVMVAAVFLASFLIGNIPINVVAFVKALSEPELISRLSSNPNDYSILGIDSNLLLILMLFPSIVGLFTFLLLSRSINDRRAVIVINGTKNIRWNRFFISALVWIILSAIYFIGYMKIDPTNFTLNNSNVTTLIILTLISLLFIPFQASFEEVLFRGYMMQGFAVLVKNRWFPLVMTSVLFGLMHSVNPEVKEFGFFTMMPQYIVFGLIFGLITIMDDGIEASMGAHAANNIFLCIMVTNKASALQTPALYEQINVYPWKEFLGLLLSGLAFIIILKVVFKWESFSVLFKKISAEKPKEIG